MNSIVITRYDVVDDEDDADDDDDDLCSIGHSKV